MLPNQFFSNHRASSQSLINRLIFLGIMLTSQLLSGLRSVRTVARRNFGVAAPALQKVSDPIQQLFLDKIREYKTKGA